MNELEKVIAGLEHCNCGGCDATCKGCPYVGMIENGFVCRALLERDAIGLLKMQVPRMLTLEEATEYAKLPKNVWSDKAPVYVEYIYSQKYYMKWLTVENLHEWLKGDRISDYNKANEFGWRCWTGKPDETTRKAVKWNLKSETG